MTLPDLTESIENVQELTALIEQHSSTINIPDNVKRFVATKITDFKLTASGLQLKSGQYTLPVDDLTLLKAASSVSFFNDLKTYKDLVENIAAKTGMSDRSFKDTFASTRETPPPNWAAWENTIDNEFDLDAFSKQAIRRFINQSSTYGHHKGIFRTDFFHPSICVATNRPVEFEKKVAVFCEKLATSQEVVEQLLKIIPNGWTDAEWSLGILIWNRHVVPKNVTRPTAEFSRKLENATTRSRGSWDRRIANIRFALTGAGLPGGTETPARAKNWQARFAASPNDIIKLASYTVKNNPDGLAVCEELGISEPKFGTNTNSNSYASMRRHFLESCEKTNFSTTLKFTNRFTNSLAAKPFLILTGNSGTGKTKIAELFVEWLLGKNAKTCVLVPVGADWTDNRNVVGFVNHLRPTKPEGELDGDVPVYQSTPILDLILNANANTGRPHFLILDEMNLSHLERYFADFLSIMESTNGLLRLHSCGRKLPIRSKGPAIIDETIPWPENLFVIGTVNVDETTYMFSPKVLDRANVIEFRIDPEKIESFLSNGNAGLGDIERAPEGYAEAFLQLSKNARTKPKPTLAMATQDSPETNKKIDQFRKILENVLRIMHVAHHEFGFRVLSEITRYAHVDFELTENREEWNPLDCLDAQLLQKILPKLHGTKKRIAPVLVALAKFCETTDNLEEALTYLSGGTLADSYDVSKAKCFATPKLEDSYAKLCDMIEAVRRDQFVSFIQ